MSEEEKQTDEFAINQTGSFEDVAGEGYLAHSLTRSGDEIKKDRAESIAEDIRIAYKRRVEDLQTEIKKIKRRMKGAFDFSPNSTFSLVLADNVEGVDVVDKDMELALEYRNKKVKLILAKKRYNHLFGKEFEINEELA